MTPMTVRKQIEIDAPAERVWPFVATREGGLRWLCNVAEVHELVLEPRVGGRFEERMVVRGREYGHKGRPFVSPGWSSPTTRPIGSK